MRILFVAPFVPGPNVDHTGGRYLFHMLESLAERNELFLVALDSRRDEANSDDALKRFCRYVEIVPLRSGLSTIGRYLRHLRWPRAVAMSYCPQLRKRVRELLQEIDFYLVQCENIQTIPYVQDARVAKVLDCIDLNFLPMFQQYLASRGVSLRRIYRALEWPRLQLYETLALRQFG